MNSKPSSTVSGALRAFQDKIVYFHAYNTVFSIWATLALIYYVVNTIDISSCSTLRYYFIFWTITYALEAIAPLVSICAVKSGRNYGAAFVSLIGLFFLKLLVIGSLLVGAWNNVGTCYIPNPYKEIILITNALQAVCLLIDYVLIYRIKAVNREILIDRLMTNRTFAQN